MGVAWSRREQAASSLSWAAATAAAPQPVAAVVPKRCRPARESNCAPLSYWVAKLWRSQRCPPEPLVASTCCDVNSWTAQRGIPSPAGPCPPQRFCFCQKINLGCCAAGESKGLQERLTSTSPWQLQVSSRASQPCQLVDIHILSNFSVGSSTAPATAKGWCRSDPQSSRRSSTRRGWFSAALLKMIRICDLHRHLQRHGARPARLAHRRTACLPSPSCRAGNRSLHLATEGACCRCRPR